MNLRVICGGSLLAQVAAQAASSSCETEFAQERKRQDPVRSRFQGFVN